MRRVLVGLSLVAAVAAVGLVTIPRSEAVATMDRVEEPADAADRMPAHVPVVELEGKRCSTNSDCRPHSQCRNRQCGGCSTNSDCGFGQCRSNQCGACSTNSDCNGWGNCRNRQCGGCSTNSDCGQWGSCRSGQCTESPYR